MNLSLSCYIHLINLANGIHTAYTHQIETHTFFDTPCRTRVRIVKQKVEI